MMLQCNRCRMKLPDGTQVCSRCGGTVLTPIQVQAQANPQQSSATNVGHQGTQTRTQTQPQRQNTPRPNQQTGQRPQRPQRAQRPQNPQNPMINGRGQRVIQNQQIINNDFFGEGLANGFDQQQNQPTVQQSQQTAQQNNQMNQQSQNNADNRVKVCQPSKDGSSIIDWLKLMISLLIPILNIWCIFKTLSKSSMAPDYKKNYIKAFLIYFIVMGVLSFIITYVFSDSIAYWIASTFLTTK